MKINWGTGIAIFMGLFILTLVWVVYESMQVDHSLVKDNYYEEDLNYQKHYDKLQNAQEKPITVKYSSDQQEITLDFQDNVQKIIGRVTFFKPDNQKLDYSVEILVNKDNEMVLSTKNMISGLWRVKIDYLMGTDAFYHEQKIVLKT